MQDRYSGDVGDFGKLGMLRQIEKLGISVGINWYLVRDEAHNNDGKHIEYLNDKTYQGCDDELLMSLRMMLEQKSRTVSELEKCSLLRSQKYYHERLNDVTRNEWHKSALEAMAECDMVFLDPDNGLLPKSVSRGSHKSIKYVLPEEIVDYYIAGHSVAFYSHRTRETLDVYLRRFDTLFHAKEIQGATIKGVSFKRGTIRDYFFILHEEHVNQVGQSLEELLKGKWNRHFSEIQKPMCKTEGIEEPVEVSNRQKRKPGKTLVEGYINRNNQENRGYLNKLGNHYNQMAYLMRCNVCGHEYEANGCDVATRKCPECM